MRNGKGDLSFLQNRKILYNEILHPLRRRVNSPEVERDLPKQLAENLRGRALLAEQRELVQKHRVIGRVHGHARTLKTVPFIIFGDQIFQKSRHGERFPYT